MPADLLALLTGGLMVAVTVLAIHDQQNIAALKRQHARLKKLEATHPNKVERLTRRIEEDERNRVLTPEQADLLMATLHEDYRSGSDSQ